MSEQSGLLTRIEMMESVSLCVIICESTTQLAGLMLPPGREWQARYKRQQSY
jgi:hypothetical protein